MDDGSLAEETMKTLATRFATCAAALVLAGCATGPEVFSDFDPEQSFTEYRTFAWIGENPMTVAGDRGPNPLVAKRLQDTIQATLVEKGFQYVADPTDADFVVAFTVGARDLVEVREREYVDYYGPHWRWGYDYYGVRPARASTRTEVSTHNYTEGTLAIDIFDTERKSPVWHGAASKRLTRDELQGRNTEAIRAGVSAILAEFPPG
ncbi:MAG: DUF4136 domain-containing protein [Pseudomonadota bacterium]